MSCFLVSNRQLNVIVNSLNALGFKEEKEAQSYVNLLHSINVSSVCSRYNEEAEEEKEFIFKSEKPLIEGVELIQLVTFIQCYLYQCSEVEHEALDDLKNISQILTEKYADYLVEIGFDSCHSKPYNRMPYSDYCDWSIEDEEEALKIA